MQKGILAVVVTTVVAINVLAWAQMNAPSGEMMGGQGMGMMGDEKAMMKGNMGGKEMMGMHGMMRKMSDKNVVATSDGGVVVIMGNKMTKYDKDLNLVKEVDLKMDMEGMKNMPPMNKDMQTPVQNQTEQAPLGAPAPDEVEHEGPR